jgi:hypothetical protein
MTVPTYVVEYLSVAGGGGGGISSGTGGAGAGGYLNSNLKIIAGRAYAVLVGAGGTSGYLTFGVATPPTQGGNSSIYRWWNRR